MRKVLRYLWRFILLLFFALATFGAVALISSYIPVSVDEENCEKTERIFVTTNGVHLFFIVDTSFFDPGFLEKLNPPSGYPFVYVGWGEREFYLSTPTWADLEPDIALKAALLPTPTAVHVTYFRSVREKWIEVHLCPNQKENLKTFIQASFEQVENDFRPLGAKGYGELDFFYEGTGSYSAFYTCNTWVNEGLKKAGVRTSLWTPFDFPVIHHLQDKVK